MLSLGFPHCQHASVPSTGLYPLYRQLLASRYWWCFPLLLTLASLGRGVQHALQLFWLGFGEDFLWPHARTSMPFWRPSLHHSEWLCCLPSLAFYKTSIFSTRIGFFPSHGGSLCRLFTCRPHGIYKECKKTKSFLNQWLNRIYSMNLKRIWFLRMSLSS